MALRTLPCDVAFQPLVNWRVSIGESRESVSLLIYKDISLNRDRVFGQYHIIRGKKVRRAYVWRLAKISAESGESCLVREICRSRVMGIMPRHSPRLTCRMQYPQTTAESLTEIVLSNLGREVDYSPIPTDGAKQVAHITTSLLEAAI
jgi:hypothetical protein